MSTPQPISSTFVLQTSALSGGPGALPLIKDLTHGWSAGLHWICGDEGTGKTSLLRLLAGDLSAMSGSVSVAPDDVFWADLQGAEHDQTTVQACWDALRPSYPRWNGELLQDLAKALDMEQHLHKRLDMLSAGSRRKVMITAALACGATVTLLDQPFVALDQASIQTLKSFFKEAATHPNRAWVVADYEAPHDLPLASTLRL
jgi:ABC-type multidrug transport system ATPase subunit